MEARFITSKSAHKHTCPQINTTPSHPHNPDCYRGEARGGSGLGLDLCFLIFYHECE